MPIKQLTVCLYIVPSVLLHALLPIAEVKLLSGVIVRPDPSDPGSTKMSLLLQNDMKGWVPHMIVNAFASRAPETWRDSLEKYYHEQYAGKK